MNKLRVASARFENEGGYKEYNLSVIAEPIPEGPSTSLLTEIAKRNDITILAGLFEKDGHNNLYKAYICIGQNGMRAKFRKLHPFIIAECRSLGDQLVIADCIYEKLQASGDNRYENARRPELYRDIIGTEHESSQKVSWLDPKATHTKGNKKA